MTMIRTLSILFLLTLLGAFLRFHNLSPFTIYPDSYQNLVVAENLKTYRSVVGFLGPNGMLYPDFFMWTRPVYAGLIALFGNAGVISYILGVAAIPLSYFVIKSIFKSSLVGLCAAALLALSFNHTVWSGFVMTESTGVFCMLLFLWSLFARRTVLSGMLLAVAVLARYEYAVVAVLGVRRWGLGARGKMFLSAGVVLLITAFTIYPWQSAIGVLFSQMQTVLLYAAIFVGVCILSILLYRFASKNLKNKISKHAPNVISVLLIIFALFSIVPIPFIRGFLFHDFLLSIFFLIGTLLLLRDKEKRNLAYVLLLTITFLIGIYYQINPTMERYMTHLLPFLLIPAGYGLRRVLGFGFWGLGVGVLVILQAVISFNGLRYLEDSSWYRTSYQEKVSFDIAQDLQTNKSILLVSMPEPYFLSTKQTTYSLTDEYPYIYISKSLDTRNVVIVEDMGMHDYFPHFTSLLEAKFRPYLKKSFSVHEQYHTTTKSVEEKYPVKVYEIKLSQLKRLLQ